MKKILYFCLVALTAIVVASCKNEKKQADVIVAEGDYGFEIVENYYKTYTKKLNNAKDTFEVNKITEEAVKDYQKMVADNSALFINMFKNNANGNIKPDDPAVKAVEVAWRECNLTLSEKTMGKYDYMPDFIDMYDLLYDKLPKELKEHTTPTQIPKDVFGNDDECDDDCGHDHSHENPFLQPSF